MRASRGDIFLVMQVLFYPVYVLISNPVSFYSAHHSLSLTLALHEQQNVTRTRWNVVVVVVVFWDAHDPG